MYDQLNRPCQSMFVLAVAICLNYSCVVPSPGEPVRPVYVYIYIYIYTYTYIHSHTRVYIYIYIHRYIHTHTHARVARGL